MFVFSTSENNILNLSKNHLPQECVDQINEYYNKYQELFKDTLLIFINNMCNNKDESKISKDKSEEINKICRQYCMNSNIDEFLFNIRTYANIVDQQQYLSIEKMWEYYICLYKCVWNQNVNVLDQYNRKIAVNFIAGLINTDELKNYKILEHWLEHRRQNMDNLSPQEKSFLQSIEKKTTKFDNIQTIIIAFVLCSGIIMPTHYLVRVINLSKKQKIIQKTKNNIINNLIEQAKISK